MPVENLLLTSAILVTGSTYTRVRDVASVMNLQLMSCSQFSCIQKEHVFPVVQEAWVKEKASVLDSLKLETILCWQGMLAVIPLVTMQSLLLTC